eukprot:6837930-Pyramimonas_sp.AAC.1
MGWNLAASRMMSDGLGDVFDLRAMCPADLKVCPHSWGPALAGRAFAQACLHRGDRGPGLASRLEESSG